MNKLLQIMTLRQSTFSVFNAASSYVQKLVYVLWKLDQHSLFIMV